MADQPHVVVIGGGFGGLNVVKAMRGASLPITLIDRHNYHLFRPLLYQVAMAGLSPAEIASPLRVIFHRDKQVRTLLAEVTDLNTAEHQVILANGQTVPYDFLVVATGSAYDYFGHNDWLPNAPSLETVESALEIRRRLLCAYEAAELESNSAKRQAQLTFVVVGGGPTGVELAGAIGELARYTLTANFRTIDPADTQVILVESLDRLLSTFPADLATKAEQQLNALGVTVLTSSKVTEIAADHVTVETPTGTRIIPCCTTLWAAGVKASALAQVLHKRTGVELTRRGQVKILPDLTLPNHPEIFVIGDMSYLEQDGKPLPGLAPVAIQQGKHVARQIYRQIHTKPLLPFRYRDRGIMATIGRAAAVADVRGIHMSGLIAWLAWLVIHVINLIGFRNRIEVMSTWIWNYLTYARTVRLIIGQSATAAQPPPAPSGPAKAFRTQPVVVNGENGKHHERSQQAQGRST